MSVLKIMYNLSNNDNVHYQKQCDKQVNIFQLNSFKTTVFIQMSWCLLLNIFTVQLSKKIP